MPCSTIRYVWITNDGRYLYRTSEFKKDDRIQVPNDPHSAIFVNILERKSYEPAGSIAVRVKLFYADGTVLEGWTATSMLPIKLTNEDELYDGRFNQ